MIKLLGADTSQFAQELQEPTIPCPLPESLWAGLLSRTILSPPYAPTLLMFLISQTYPTSPRFVYWAFDAGYHDRVFKLYTPSYFRLHMGVLYHPWFDRFLLLDVKERRIGKFGLSSTPGCGKTMGILYLIKLAISAPRIVSQTHPPPVWDGILLHSRRTKVRRATEIEAADIAEDENTFYILDGHKC